MKITLLGTGSPIPDPNRAGPCTLVQAGAQNIMIDCGRAAIMRLLGAGVLPGMVSTILITHLHSDHITDLNDLVTTRWVMMPVNIPLKVVGPTGTRQVVDAMLNMLTLDQGYRHAHHEDLRANGPLTVDVVEVGAGESFSIGEVTVSTHATDHRPVDPSIGYRIEHDGKVAALAGDTIPCPGLDDLCQNADVYVQTVIRDDQVKQLASLLPNSQRFLDILDYHSTVSQAGQTAARNNVKTLMLTHCVPAVQPGQEDDWIGAAREHFSGNIVLGPDLTFAEV
ncbi:MAG: MBL fold metallo-hydrolase [Actinobacteria bacterium]|nr:MBL fold metallo-hydrolase [Actinomycetota bacterium]NDB05447.1 MBL fold metallo-hydrolase [Acidimicrobiia bacterium]NDE79332.1 MBL fold metallo-hydrolase [Actinomycetota bacterium]